ncbi:uncharacterized protein [Diadema setosum]|uniref:uncharacterized protein n=1 Tax=Diadema setosum TaxID=31175 RepID=UPI003B3A5818
MAVNLCFETGTGCPPNFYRYEDTCFGATTLPESDMSKPCLSLGGAPATWSDDKEFEFLVSVLPTNSSNEFPDNPSVGSWSIVTTNRKSPVTYELTTDQSRRSCTICEVRRVNSIYHDASVYYPMDRWHKRQFFDAITGQWVGAASGNNLLLKKSHGNLENAIHVEHPSSRFSLDTNLGDDTVISDTCEDGSCYSDGTTVSFWVNLPPSDENSTGDRFTCLVRTAEEVEYTNYSFCQYAENDAIMTTGSQTWSLFQDIVDNEVTTWAFVVASWVNETFRGCVWPREMQCYVCHSFPICRGCMDEVHRTRLHFGWARATFDEFAVWHRPLEDSEIIHLFNQTEPRLILGSLNDVLSLLDELQSRGTLTPDETKVILDSSLRFVQTNNSLTSADELQAVSRLVVGTIGQARNNNSEVDILLENLQTALDIVSELTDSTHKKLWTLTTSDTNEVPCPCELTTGIGEYAESIAKALHQLNETMTTTLVLADRAAAQITSVAYIEPEDVYGDGENQSLVITIQSVSALTDSSPDASPSVTVSVPLTVLDDQNASLVVVVIYDHVYDIFPSRENSTVLLKEDGSFVPVEDGSTSFISSAVIDVKFIPSPDPDRPFDPPITLTFELGSEQVKAQENNEILDRICVYWDLSYNGTNGTTRGLWSTRGCHRVSYNDTHVTCSCTHLTHFAVLMTREPSDLGGHAKALEILSNIGCALSVSGSGGTVAAILLLRMTTDRVLIHCNLATSMFMAQLLFLSQGSIPPGTVGCKVMAGTMYFFFMASFCWMMIEGLQLYTQVVVVFNQESSKMRLYLAGGWGVPLIMTIIVVGSTHKTIGTRLDSCWLDYSDNSVWSFIVPALLIVVVNLFILLRVTVVIVNLKNHDQLRRDEAAYQKLKYSLKAALTISPLMGSTWLFGVLTLADSSNVGFLYLFVLSNSIQGLLIFILYCLNSQEVRDTFKRRVEMYRLGRSVRRFKIHPTGSSVDTNSTIEKSMATRGIINTVSSTVTTEMHTGGN